MSVVLIIFGCAVAALGFGGWAMTLAQSAVQQTVLELRFIGGALGLVLVGIGMVLGRMRPLPPEPVRKQHATNSGPWQSGPPPR